MTMSRLTASLICALLSLLGANLALAGNVAVGSCKPTLPSYPTISAAVASAPAGSTVEICPGSYYEQVFINQSLNLNGITSGNSSDVVIYPPASGLSSLTDISGFVLAPGVVVNAGPVNISNVTVDGNGYQNSGASCVGIFYNDGVSGTVNGVTVRNQNCGHPAYDSGLWANTSTSSTLAVENSSFHDIGDSSVDATGGINLTLKGNTLEASGYNAQIFTAQLTMTGNVIVGGGCCTGLSVAYSQGTVSGNTIDNTYQGIWAQGGSSLEFTRNNLSNLSTGIVIDGSSGDTYKFNTIARTGVAIDFNCNTATVTSNIIREAKEGFDYVPASFAGTNTFNSVANIRNDGCADAQTTLKPEKQGVPMPAPSH